MMVLMLERHLPSVLSDLRMLTVIDCINKIYWTTHSKDQITKFQAMHFSKNIKLNMLQCFDVSNIIIKQRNDNDSFATC